MTGPKPGQPVRGSTTGRPIMALLDFLGRRWVLRILWELRAGPQGFRRLQSRCDNMSPSVLAGRLAGMQEAGMVAIAVDGGYVLTSEGETLLHILHPLNDWAERWASRYSGDV